MARAPGLAARLVARLVAPRVLRSRYGFALLLAAVVAGVVGVGQLADPAGRTTGGLRPDAQAAVTVAPHAGDDGEAAAPTTPEPATSPGAMPPEQVAELFATAWIDHRQVDSPTWLARLRPYATERLAGKLAGVDPAGVPADRLTGPAKLAARAESYVEVTVPVDAGVLRLHVVGTDGRWLVDSVDWERQ